MMDMKDKVVMITGAASGMGKAQAGLFAEKGAKVVATDIEMDALEEVVKKAKGKGGEIIAMETDVSDKKSVDEAVRKTNEKYGHIDVLVNTAGVFDEMTKSLDTDEELWDRIMNINLKGLFLMTNAVLKVMLEQGKGVIINVASIAGLTTGGGGASYTASKHGVVGYTKQLSYDYGKEGIRINAIAPGTIETALIDVLPKEHIEQAAESVPAQRNGTAEDIAKLTLFLASDESDFIHGAILPIDGGHLIS